MKNPLIDITEIVSELDVAQHDAWLCENDVVVQSYFDTTDVRRAVLGAREYISAQEERGIVVDVKEFERPEILADCLLAAGLLGSFAMLPPHQAEFLKLLKDDIKFQVAPRKLDQSDFLKSVGIEDPWGAGNFEKWDDKKLSEFVRRFAGKQTERFFKAIQCIRMPWWEQLKSLRHTKTFMPISERFDYASMLRDKLLPRLMGAFQKVRGRQHDHPITKNNFADAISLLMLVDLVKRYTTGQSMKVPRFFDSTGIFMLVAKETGLLPELMIVSGGFRSSALVTTNYLVYRASLRSRNRNENILSTLKSAVSSSEQFAATELRRLEPIVQGRTPPLNSPLRQYIDLSFLENVWLKTLALDDLRDIAKRWASEEVLTQRFRETVDQTIEVTVKDVLRGADEYRKVSTAWLGLRKEVLDWRKKLQGLHVPGEGLDEETEMGLFRFSPRPETMARVRDALLKMLADDIDDDDVTNLTVWYDFVMCCIDLGRAAAPQDVGEMEATAEFVAATLWAIKADNQLLDILKPFVSSRSFFIRTVYAAAILRLGRDARKSESIVADLEAEVNQLVSECGTGECNWNMLIQSSSLAYLWFHLWQAKWNRPAWWRCFTMTEDLSRRRREVDRYLSKAIECIDIAWRGTEVLDITDDERRARVVYVINQRLYYLVEQGKEGRDSDMLDTYQRMMEYRTSAKDLFRPTYLDTLARYYAFKAALSRTEESWQRNIGYAEDYYREAKSAEKSDQVIRNFGEYLAHVKERGFSPPAK